MNDLSHSPFPNDPTIEDTLPGGREIVYGARSGSPAAFAELYALYSRRLFSTIISITKCREDAEDALQETFLRAYGAMHTFEGRSSVYSWLTRIAVNSALMILRRRRSRPEILFDPQPGSAEERVCLEVRDPSPNPEQICDLRIRQQKLMRAVHNLRPDLREPIRLQITRDASLDEIGKELNITQAAVKARLHRARLRISAACRTAR